MLEMDDKAFATAALVAMHEDLEVIEAVLAAPETDPRFREHLERFHVLAMTQARRQQAEAWWYIPRRAPLGPP